MLHRFSHRKVAWLSREIFFCSFFFSKERSNKSFISHISEIFYFRMLNSSLQSSSITTNSQFLTIAYGGVLWLRSTSFLPYDRFDRATPYAHPQDMLIARCLTICHGCVSVDRWFSGRQRRYITYISFRESYDSSIVCASLLRRLIFRGRSYGPVLILLIPRVILHRSFPFSGETFTHVGFSAIFKDYTSVRDIFYVILHYFLSRKQRIKFGLKRGVKRGLINTHLSTYARTSVV